MAWMVLVIIVMSWPDIYCNMFKLKQYSETDLTRISTRFAGINRRMTVWTLCAGLLAVVAAFALAYLVTVTGGTIDRVFPAISGAIVLGSLVFPLFARASGAFPVPKSYQYLVEPIERVSALSRSHIALVGLSIAGAAIGVILSK